MKFKHLFLALILLMAVLIAISCVTTNGDNGDNDGLNPPNFVSDPCGGCKTEEYIGNVITFFSYVKNIGGTGVISMTINPGDFSATKEFTVTAGTSYVFQASVPVEPSSTITFIYTAHFPGSAEYSDTREKPGFHVTGAPSNLQFTPK